MGDRPAVVIDNGTGYVPVWSALWRPLMLTRATPGLIFELSPDADPHIHATRLVSTPALQQRRVAPSTLASTNASSHEGLCTLHAECA